MIYKYYGPPGTGKTFKLISRAKAYARLGTPLHKIGYFAFSKKAAGVAKERMPANDKNLPYFQTLHSFCFTFLDINMEDIMQPYHYEKFGKEINVKVKYADKYNKELIKQLAEHYQTSQSEATEYIGLMNKEKCDYILTLYGYSNSDKKRLLKGIK